jgi:hypothetical protein
MRADWRPSALQCLHRTNRICLEDFQQSLNLSTDEGLVFSFPAHHSDGCPENFLGNFSDISKQIEKARISIRCTMGPKKILHTLREYHGSVTPNSNGPSPPL